MDSLKCKALLRSIELGSMSAAAEDLGYSTAGISRMITAIEDEMGFQVVNRDRSGITLTKNGEDLRQALLLYSQADDIASQVSSEINGLARGRLLIGTYSSIAANWLPEVILDFSRDYPGISIQLMEGVHSELDQWMNSTRMDFCLYSYRPDMEMEWLPIRNDQMYAVVHPHHPFAERTSIRPEEIDGQPFIMPSQSNDIDVMDLLRRFNVRPDIRYTTIENYSALSMIEYGLGVSIMNELITQGRIAHVVLVPFDPPQYIEMGIAIPSLKAAVPAAKKFIQYIQKHLLTAEL